MSKADSAVLRLYELSLVEKEAMAASINRIISLIDGEKPDTTVEKELTIFVQHLSNVRSFLSKRDSESAGDRVEWIMGDLRLSKLMPLPLGIEQRVIEGLRSILAMPIDYSKLRSRKWKAILAAHAVAVETEK